MKVLIFPIVLFFLLLFHALFHNTVFASERPEIIVLAFDGADRDLTKRWIEQGHLPNLEKLQKTGCFLSLVPPYPPQTPVSWASFSTGKNPGKTTIFDFLKRDPKTYMPDFAMNSVSRKQVLWGKQTAVIVAPSIGALLFLVVFFSLFFTKCRRLTLLSASVSSSIVVSGVLFFLIYYYLPEEFPVVKKNQQGKTIWELATENGISTRVIRFPNTFPPDQIENGQMLAGLGVPDIRGTMGTFSYYTDETVETEEDTEMGGKIIPVQWPDHGDIKVETIIYGPRNKLYNAPPEEINIPLTLEIMQKKETTDIQSLKIAASGTEQILGEGEWSEWFVLEFPFNPLVKMYGIARFHLISLMPLKLYMSPVNFHPGKPPLPLSHPEHYSKDLVKSIGLFKTLGWAIDTWALNEKRIDEKLFLEDTDFTIRKEVEMLKQFLRNRDVRLYIQLFEFTDRIQHMFWRFTEEDHPAYNKQKAEQYKGTILEYYKKMDEIVGMVLEEVDDDDDTVFIVCSDHGFNSFKKAVNYNTWLVKNNLMTLTAEDEYKEKNLEDLFGRGQFWPNVNWYKTKAYALGLGNIYINLQGREAYGIVRPGKQYENIRNRIKEQLEAWVDEETGEKPVRHVYKREEIYTGFDQDLVPDLIVANNNGYRVSWQTSLGGIPKEVLEDNEKGWSADHCSLDPEITKGIFFSNLKFDEEETNIMDIFPTVLQLLDIQIPTDIDGHLLKYHDISEE